MVDNTDQSLVPAAVDKSPLDDSATTKFDPNKWNDRSDQLRSEIESAVNGGYSPLLGRFILACLSAIPGVGGAIGGVAGAWSEKDQDYVNDLFSSWFRLQADEMMEIGKTLFEVIIRLDRRDADVQKRIRSKEYLSLIKKAFRNWSAAESEEKRKLIRNLLTNAGAGQRVCTDDVIGLFIEWIDKYSEAHFKVISAIYNSTGITRQGIWAKIHGVAPAREDSADADLFKVLVSDLTLGHVIRQHREKDYYGNYIKQPPVKRGTSGGYVSAFDDEKPYELTELGNQFVHYTMNEIVPRLGAPEEV